MAEMEQYPQEWRDYQPIQPRGGIDWRGLFRKLWAPIAAVAAFLVKFGAVLLKAKFLFSMFVSAAFYVWLGGWWFGIGLVVLLFVHEMGHVLEAKNQGLPVSAPLFIPFMGALITLKQMPHNAWREARLAIAGPLLGSAGALAIYLAGVAFDSRALKVLAFLGFFINLFNRPNPILIIILIFSASELWRRWQTRRHPEMQEYYKVKPHQRVIIGVLYFGLAVLLVLGMHATHVPRDF